MLESRNTQIGEERSTRSPLSEAEVRALLAVVDEVVLARGQRAERRPAAGVKPADLKGPTGNFRAPMVRRGRVLLVGFHPEALAGLL